MEALRWWRENRTRAPELLRAELRLAYQIIRSHPFAGADVDDPDLPGIRRLTLSATSYFLFYRVLPDRVVIVALWHHSREGKPRL